MVIEPDPKHSRNPDAPLLRVRLEGDGAELGKVAASDVANLLLLTERAIARSASVAMGKPSRKVGRRKRAVAEASHLVLMGIERGSVVPVLELPRVRRSPEDQQSVETNDEHLAEIAAGQLLDVISGKIDGHPYVVEVLAQMGEQLAIGLRYDRVGFEVVGTNQQLRRCDLDSPVAIRMQERVKLFRAATRKGLLIGTLVEADFEAYTARLRTTDGGSVAVAFDPGMAAEIKGALTQPGAIEGWITYDPANHVAQSINLQRVVTGHQTTLDLGDRAFRKHQSFSELQAEQSITGPFDVHELRDLESSEIDLEMYDKALRRLTDV